MKLAILTLALLGVFVGASAVSAKSIFNPPLPDPILYQVLIKDAG